MVCPLPQSKATSALRHASVRLYNEKARGAGAVPQRVVAGRLAAAVPVRVAAAARARPPPRHTLQLAGSPSERLLLLYLPVV